MVKSNVLACSIGRSPGFALEDPVHEGRGAPEQIARARAVGDETLREGVLTEDRGETAGGGEIGETCPVLAEHDIREHDQAIRLLLPDRREGTLEIVRRARLQRQEPYAQAPSGRLGRPQLRRVAGIARVPEDREQRRLRHDLLQHLQQLAGDFRRHVG